MNALHWAPIAALRHSVLYMQHIKSLPFHNIFLLPIVSQQHIDSMPIGGR